jgi:acetoacetyl-CoA synthetase
LSLLAFSRPRTLSGKALEVPIKRVLHGTPPETAVSRDSLANPDALDWARWRREQE